MGNVSELHAFFNYEKTLRYQCLGYQKLTVHVLP